MAEEQAVPQRQFSQLSNREKKLMIISRLNEKRKEEKLRREKTELLYDNIRLGASVAVLIILPIFLHFFFEQEVLLGYFAAMLAFAFLENWMLHVIKIPVYECLFDKDRPEDGITMRHWKIPKRRMREFDIQGWSPSLKTPSGDSAFIANAVIVNVRHKVIIAPWDERFSHIAFVANITGIAEVNEFVKKVVMKLQTEIVKAEVTAVILSQRFFDYVEKKAFAKPGDADTYKIPTEEEIEQAAKQELDLRMARQPYGVERDEP